MTRPSSACWLPPELRAVVDAMPGGVTRFVKRYEHDGQSREVAFERLSAQALAEVTASLRRRRREVLLRRTVAEIVELLNRAAALWLDPAYPPRRETIEEIAFITRFSPEMVDHAIEEEQVSSRGAHLLAALENELGDPGFLDGFRPNPRLGGLSRAFGPELVGAIFSSNIPALPHLEIMRSMLLKAACLGRVSAGEPIFLRRYVETLAELDPDVASCLAVIYWERGDEEAEAAFLRSIDHLVAYGGDAQVDRLRSVKPAGLEATWHGHRLGFLYLAREALADDQDVRALAGQVAYDFTIFDGFACLCPQVCLVEEGGAVSPAAFARMCAEEMARLCRELPPRSLDLADASSRHVFRELCLMSPAMDVVAAPEDCSFLVAVEALDRFVPSCGDRFLRVAPVAGTADLERLVGALPRHYLQCAAIAAGAATARLRELRETLAGWGVTRVVPPGIMGRPSMMWHHDGVACLGRMISWCDHELVLPERLLAAGAPPVDQLV